MMHMTFYWSRYVTLLFPSWRTDSYPTYLLTLLACFLFSVFYQYMEDLRLRLKLASKKNKSSDPPAPATHQTPLLGRSGKRDWIRKYASGAVFGVNSAIGYLLMLAVMSFNGGVFVAIVAGLTVGYLVFRCGDEDEGVVLENPCACA